jgi:hypothetical protein
MNMKLNKKGLIPSIFLLAVATGVGCGGVGAPYSGETPYIGSFSGPWSLASSDEFGRMTLTVTGDARMNGTVQNVATGETGMVTGRVERDGKYFATVKYAGGVDVDFNGRMNRKDGNYIAGDGTYARPGQPTAGVWFDFDDRPINDVFTQGPWRGTWRTAGDSEVGTMTMTIGNTGIISGIYSNLTTADNGFLAGFARRDGVFQVVLNSEDGTRTRILGVMHQNTGAGVSGDGTLHRPGQSPIGFSFDL